MTTTLDIENIRPTFVTPTATFPVINTCLHGLNTIALFIGACGLLMLGDSLHRAMHNHEGEWYIDVHSYTMDNH